MEHDGAGWKRINNDSPATDTDWDASAGLLGIQLKRVVVYLDRPDYIGLISVHQTQVISNIQGSHREF